LSRAPRSLEDYRDGVTGGDRRALSKAITLLESRRPDHVELGRRVLEAVVPRAGRAIRLGITGPPGVGKSSFIEALGIALIEKGHRLAVLAVDPTSPVSGGSILGDKTRMVALSQREEAFIRPSPSGGMLGGVAHRTREARILCEAAGFDVVIVETVGVGQSEFEVASMVDFFLVLLQPGAGDELQGIKKGVLELADMLVVHKADGDQLESARRARAEYAQAMKLLRAAHEPWQPPVLVASSHTGQGILEVWDRILTHRRALQESGELERRRRRQDRAWLWSLVEDGLRGAFRAHPDVSRRLPEVERAVEANEISAPHAARELLELLRGNR
jgi:LAO/AO transport system kinase